MIRTLPELNVTQKLVFLRVDFNVPFTEDRAIANDTRIRAALPTILSLLKNNARIVVATHVGRPDGVVVPALSTQPIAKRLKELLDGELHTAISVDFVADCVGAEVDAAKDAVQPGNILMLENLRFHAEEEMNDEAFTAQLAKNIDVYVNDAFGAIHRKHASIYGVPARMPNDLVAAGLLLEKEMAALDHIAHQPKKPFVVMIGGIKLSDKVAVIEHLAPMADAVLLAGGVANVFLKSQGIDIGASKIEEAVALKSGEQNNATDVATKIAEKFANDVTSLATHEDGTPQSKIVLPIDAVIAPSPKEPGQARVIQIGDAIPEGWMYLDIGPATKELYSKILGQAATTFWNGPLGVFEVPEFAQGSRMIAETIAQSHAYSVLGGGDTESMLEQFGLQGKYSHVSTGGGASLEYISGVILPGIDILDKK